MTLFVRPAQPNDAQHLSQLLGEIIRQWNSVRRYDPEYVLAHYIEHPDRVSCTVAANDANEILGFQSLKIARSGNPYDVASGWGIIGTYVRLGQAHQGIGQLLFTATHKAALNAGLPSIDATIGANNKGALKYYGKLGFCAYRTLPDAIHKRFDVI